jgi:hypothetical protein
MQVETVGQMWKRLFGDEMYKPEEVMGRCGLTSLGTETVCGKDCAGAITMIWYYLTYPCGGTTHPDVRGPALLAARNQCEIFYFG